MKGQGTLEYFIILVAILAIASVIVLFASGGLRGKIESAQYGICRQAASTCNTIKQADPAANCSECFDACLDKTTNKDIGETFNATKCCMLGQPENIHTDSTGCAVGAISVLVITNPSPALDTAPLTVAFYGYASGGIPPYIYSWDFGDGETSTEQNPTHTYTSSAAAILTVTDSDSPLNTGSKSVSITVT